MHTSDERKNALSDYIKKREPYPCGDRNVGYVLYREQVPTESSHLVISSYTPIGRTTRADEKSANEPITITRHEFTIFNHMTRPDRVIIPVSINYQEQEQQAVLLERWSVAVARW